MTIQATTLIDLHTHSTESDGSCTPTQVLELAERQNLGAVALTDHDTTAGVDEFLTAAEGRSIIAIPGAEISTTFERREVHIVGLFIDHKSSDLNNFLKKIADGRHERNQGIIAKLQARGYDITLKEAAEQAGGDIVGRPHIAKTLLNKGGFESMNDVFDRLLKRGRPGYVARPLTSPPEAIAQIHGAGGVAVWAHPIFRQAGEYPWCRKAIKYLKRHGLDALEVYYSSFNEEQSNALIDYAVEFDLGMSGGSDFHGDNHESTIGIGNGGLRVPFKFYEQLLVRAEKYR